jgi:hypothetical protein
VVVELVTLQKTDESIGRYVDGIGRHDNIDESIEMVEHVSLALCTDAKHCIRSYLTQGWIGEAGKYEIQASIFGRTKWLEKTLLVSKKTVFLEYRCIASYCSASRTVHRAI